MMMSFIGSIGSVMKGSGLEEALETAYGHNSVTHMISGKAISRALRGHFLVEAALVNKLISALLPCELETLQNCSEFEEDRGPDDTVGLIPNPNLLESEQNFNTVQKIDSNEVDKICEFYKGFMEGTMLISEIVESAEFSKLEDCLLKYKALLSK